MHPITPPQTKAGFQQQFANSWKLKNFRIIENWVKTEIKKLKTF